MIKSTLIAAAILSVTLGGTAQAQPPVFAPDRIVPESRVEMQLSFAPLVREALPAVVNVFSTRTVQQRPSFFSRGPRSREQNSLGSGVIVDASGVIVTNLHVVNGADTLRVVLADRREYEATILLTDERTDLAVLKIETDEPLPVLPYDMSGSAEVGDLVLAIGNAFGVGQTVTSGIVSALARTDVGESDYAFFLQTDASINPGNSGGALVDMDGELIGINTMINSASGGSNGIGFAIPVEMVRLVVESAMSEGELIRPWLGASLQPVTGDLAEVFGLDRPRGIVVNEIYPDAAADRAGLRQGDIILAIDDVEVNDQPGANFRLATHSVGDDADFTVLRGGEELSLEVGVSPAPGDLDPLRVDFDGSSIMAGVSLVRLSPAYNETIGVDPFLDGIVFLSIHRRSSAARQGIRAGDVLIELDGYRIEDVEQARDILDNIGGRGSLPIVIERNGDRIEGLYRY